MGTFLIVPKKYCSVPEWLIHRKQPVNSQCTSLVHHPLPPVIGVDTEYDNIYDEEEDEVEAALNAPAEEEQET